MEGALCIFQSAILQTEIQFKKAKMMQKQPFLS